VVSTGTMAGIDDLLENAAEYAERYPAADLTAAPEKQLAVVACMDGRIDVHALFGLAEGDAHVIRNAGGAITDDVIRSLAASQRLLGTREVLLVQHTGCGLHGLSDEEFADAVERDTGQRPPWQVGGFEDLEEHVRLSIRRVAESPFLPHTDRVRGFVFDTRTGTLTEVSG